MMTVSPLVSATFTACIGLASASAFAQDTASPFSDVQDTEAAPIATEVPSAQPMTEAGTDTPTAVQQSSETETTVSEPEADSAHTIASDPVSEPEADSAPAITNAPVVADEPAPADPTLTPSASEEPTSSSEESAVGDTTVQEDPYAEARQTRRERERNTWGYVALGLGTLVTIEAVNTITDSNTDVPEEQRVSPGAAVVGVGLIGLGAYYVLTPAPTEGSAIHIGQVELMPTVGVQSVGVFGRF